jgi:hypothetical protein
MQRLLLPLLLILGSCCPRQENRISWAKKQLAQQQQQQQVSAAALEMGAEEKQNETLQEGETAYMQCRIKNLLNR